MRAPARTVGRLDGATIFVAPMRNGYCQKFAIRHHRAFGGCDGRSTGRDAEERSSDSVSVAGIAARNGFVLFGGSTQLAPGAKLYVVYADRVRQTVPGCARDE